MSDYPERPQGGKRPPAPGIKRNKPSSEHVAGRRNGWLEKVVAAPAGHIARITYDKLDRASCVFGHNNANLQAFLRKQEKS